MKGPVHVVCSFAVALGEHAAAGTAGRPVQHRAAAGRDLFRRSGAGGSSPGLVAETLATNLNAPTALAIAPDGRVFIADQTGPVRVWKDGRLLAAPALNLAGRVDDFWERGLLGLALHPDYPHTPHLFVLYVARLPFTHHVVSRFTMLGDRAHPSSELVLNRGTIWRDGKKWQPDSGLLVRFRPVA